MVVELLGMVVAVRGWQFFLSFSFLHRFELYGVFRVGILIGLHIGRLVHC